MREKVRSLRIEFESMAVIMCGWKIRLAIITYLGGKNARD